MGWPIGDGTTVPSSPPVHDGLWAQSRNFPLEWAAAHPLEVARYSRMRSTTTALETAHNPRPPPPQSAEWYDESFDEWLAAISSPVFVAVGELDFAAAAGRSLATLVGIEHHALADADLNAFAHCLPEFLAVIEKAAATAG